MKDRTKAYTRSGHQVDNLGKSKYGGWHGDVNGITLTWCFDFTYPKMESYNPVERRRIRKGELDIVKLPIGFDYVPAWHTKEQMNIVLSKR